MYVQVKNDNYGYAVATYGDYVAVSNPAIVRSGSLITASYTGSVDYFRYNRITDQHDYVATLYKQPIDIDVLLAAESASLSENLQTEDTGSFLNHLIEIDKDRYTGSIEDGFGFSLDMNGTILVVGSPYYNQFVKTSASFFDFTSSAVDIFDLSLTELVPGSSSVFIYTIENPDTNVTDSFGRGVSLNNAWLAVGSPYVSSSNGMVYMYRNTSTGSNYSWSFFQTVQATGAPVGAMFGSCLELNKQSGSFSSSMVVGVGNPSSSMAFYFVFESGSWTQKFTFNPTFDILPLTFGTYQPYAPTMSVVNGYGTAVSMFGDAVVIGEYLDRLVYEYSGSSQYQQGSVYIYEKCQNLPYVLFALVLKTYGSGSACLKNNRLGYSVDMFGNNALIGIPKINNASMGACYLAGTIRQLHYCNSDLEHLLDGQAMLLQKNTSSNEWDTVNIYQKKKRFLSPYRAFGDSVSIADKSMVVGAPMSISGSNRQFQVLFTQSLDVPLDDVCGKGYIYNLKNLREQFHVGNVFYRNGKIILMTSGSIFDGLFFNPIRAHTYEYDLAFKSQHTIYEKQVVCTINSGEFNVSTNPSAVITNTSSLDLNGNGKFDFQDVDVLLRYMEIKNTFLLQLSASTDWSSSIVTTDDEMSLLNWYQTYYDAADTPQLTSESIVRFEKVDTWMQSFLDINQDSRIDFRDMTILWKYFTNRLTQDVYAANITPACDRKAFSDAIDYLNLITQKHSIHEIKPTFLNYESSVLTDKTGSFLAPYVTTIGLYDELDLVAVAKLGSPVKVTPELPVNFVVKMDF